MQPGVADNGSKNMVYPVLLAKSGKNAHFTTLFLLFSPSFFSSSLYRFAYKRVGIKPDMLQ